MGDFFVQFAGLPAGFAATLLSLFGLLVGSFLNVVVHRLPIMMEREWQEMAAELNDPKNDVNDNHNEIVAPEFNLVTPRSRCPQCGHAITWYENIPLISWLALRGKCSSCKSPISVRYPLVELTTALAFFAVGFRSGINPGAIAWCGFFSCLIALTLIDWDTTLLPDSLTIPLVWMGLLCAQLQWSAVGLDTALWGAVSGYMSLWLIVKVFWLVTGKIGMGQGDFKLFAALGAWFGWQALIPIVIFASVAGAVIGLVIKLRGKLREGGVFPFGPFLVAGGALHWIWPLLLMS